MATAQADNLVAPSGAVRGRFGRGVPSGAPPLNTQALGVYRTTSEFFVSDWAAGSGIVADPGDGRPVVPARGAIADPKAGYNTDNIGPNSVYIERYSQYAHRTTGGDWIGLDGARQSTTAPWASQPLNAVTAGASTYTGIDVSELAKVAYDGQGPFLMVARLTSGSGARSLAGLQHPSITQPGVVVTYTDTTSETLPCTAVARIVVGTSYSWLGRHHQELQQPCYLQFRRPTKPVQSAVMGLAVSEHSATAATVEMYLANPPRVFQGLPQLGLARAYTKDAGIAAHTNVIAARTYAAGTALSDHLHTGIESINVFNTANWDPAVLGTGSSDTSKLPHAYLGTSLPGKWFYKQRTVSGNAAGLQDTSTFISMVQPSYTGDSFVPLAADVGALRIAMPAGVFADGGVTQGSGCTAADLWSLWPVAICGNDVAGIVSKRMYLRFTGGSKRVQDMRMIRNGTGQVAQYARRNGKFSIGFHHWTSKGGNNLSGGGGLGWSGRGGYEMIPGESGQWFLLPYSHDIDMLGTDTQWGADGMASALYQDTWYCIEERFKLNTWNPAGGSPTDGWREIYINGTLAVRHAGLRFRDGAIDTTGSAGNLSAFGTMGPMGTAFNVYQGGVLEPDEPFVLFLAGEVEAKNGALIGPMGGI